MTDVKALGELLAKVEAGLFNFWIADAALKYTNATNAEKAFCGSLDAAKALHESVMHESAKVSMYFSVRYEEESSVTIKHHMQNFMAQSTSPARAWLIAIIKALISEANQ